MTVVEIPSWLVEQFEVESGEPGLKEDRVERFEVPGMTDVYGDPLHVELECCSGQSNWWATINVFHKRTGELVAQSEPFHDILGLQEFFHESDMGEFDLSFMVVEGIEASRLDTTEALRLLKGLAQNQMTEEMDRSVLRDPEAYDPAEILDAFIAQARRLVYPSRPKITRN